MLVSIKKKWNRLMQFCGLLALLIITASCSSDSGNGGGTPTDSGGTTTLFQDDFAGTSLSTAWTPTAFGGTIQINSGTGQPAPSLYIQSDSGFTTQSFVILSQPYNNASGVSFSIQVRVDDPGRAGLNIDGVRITIHDQGRNSAQASITFRRFTTGSENLNIDYRIYPGGAPSQLVTETNISLSLGFHEFQFTILPDLTAKWTRDGIQRLATVTGVQILQADLQLNLNVRGPSVAAHFDNAVVSR